MTSFMERLLHSSDNFWMWPIVGACGGLVLFYCGFCMLQRKRLILNTPTSKIRSASLGLVEVNGLAVGPYTINAPVTGRPCYYYRTLAWGLRKSGKNEEWEKVADESLHVRFYLDDNTGRVLVNPQGAEMELHRDFHEEYSDSIFFTSEMPENVRNFLARHAVSGAHKVKVDEYCIKPKNALFVFGTLAENPGIAVAATPVPTHTLSVGSVTTNLKETVADKLATALKRHPGSTETHAMTIATPDHTRGQVQKKVIRLSPAVRHESLADMTQQGKIAAALTKAEITNPAAWKAAGIDNPASEMATATAAAPGKTEAVTEAVDHFDLEPKVILMKGANNSAFMICWRSQREVVQSLNWKSAAYIWGGPVLTLVSVYVLLFHFGWL